MAGACVSPLVVPTCRIGLLGPAPCQSLRPASFSAVAAALPSAASRPTPASPEDRPSAVPVQLPGGEQRLPSQYVVA